jgi:hypothetical protein
MTVRRPAVQLAVWSTLTLASCVAPHAGVGPAGWRKAGATTWVQGSDGAEQRYVSRSAAFSGSLKDLASQETINVLLRNPGVHFVGSLPLAQCPAQAGLATFGSSTHIIEAAFSVQNGQAVTILYLRPARAKASDAVRSAMGATLCAQAV